MAQVWVYRFWRFGFICLLGLTGAVVTDPAIAQITPDATLGNEGSRVTRGARVRGQNADRIDGGAVRGSNLFHSFREFNVNDGQRVYFANPAGVNNILSRVTGNDVSDIMGTLGVDGGANLFLINPNGIIFGPNARLDISGSFVGSTANKFTFPNGSEFSATDPQAPPLLNVSVPVGVQYGPGASANISNSGNLSTGQDLTLSASNLDVQGQLQAGRDLTLEAQNRVQVQPGSTLSSSRDTVVRSPIRLLGNANYTTGGYFITEQLDGSIIDFLNPHAKVVQANGDVSFFVDYEGPPLYILAGGRVQLEKVTITGEDGGTTTRDIPDGVGGTQSITVESNNQPTFDVRAGTNWGHLPGGLPENTNTSSTTPTFGVRANPNAVSNSDIVGGAIQARQTTSNENVGGVNLSSTAGNITIASIDTSNLGSGNGGSITLSAAGDIITTGSFTYERQQIRPGGQLLEPIESPPIALASFSNSNAYKDSNFRVSGGAISLFAGNTITTGNVFSYSISDSRSTKEAPESNYTGHGGAINFSAGNNITTGDLSSFSGLGGLAENGGAINLSANNNITTGDLFSGLRASIHEGNGGAINLSAGNNITTGDLDSFVDLPLSENAGNGGAINLSAGNNITINGNVFSWSDSSFSALAGHGGAINFSAGNAITINGNVSSRSSSLENEGDGGDITLFAGHNITVGELSSFSGELFPENNSENGGSGNGGAIFLLSTSGDIRTGAIRWGSSTVGVSNGALIVNTAGNVVFVGSLRPSGADTLIGNLIAPLTVQLPNAVLTDGGSFDLTAAGDLTINNTDLITSQRDGSSGQISIQTPGILTLNRSRLFTSVEPQRTGTGGNIVLEIGSLALSNFSVIDTATFSNGNAGGLQITAANNITLNQSDIVSITAGNGNAGFVSIAAGGDIALQNRSNISTAARLGATGNGGNIVLQAKALTLSGGGQLQAFTQGSGNSGDIVIQANGISVSGIGPDGLRSGVFTSSDTPTSGRGGDITVITPGTLRVADGGVFSAQTRSSVPGGQGGNITIDADTVQLINGGQLLTSTVGSERAGNIALNVPGQIVISGSKPDLQEPNLPAFACFINGVTCETSENSDVEFSTRIPHVTLSETQLDEYTINITTPGTRAVFDIDGAGHATFKEPGERTSPSRDDTALFLLDRDKSSGDDTALFLLNSQGSLLAANDNADASLGGSGSRPDKLEVREDISQNLATGRDAYLRYVFDQPGTYTVRVNRQSIGERQPFSLQVSLEAPAAAGRVIETSSSSGLFARTTSNGRAGNVSANTPLLRVLNGAQVSAETSEQGNAGTLTLQPFQGGQTLAISLDGDAQISGSTSSRGQGGSLRVIAPESVNLSGNGRLSVETTGIGRAGSLSIDTNQLTIQNGAQVSASTSSTDSSARGGDVTLHANQLNLFGHRSGIFAETRGAAPAGDISLQPYRNGGGLSINFRNHAQISASTSGSGVGGNVNVTAPNTITVRGNGTLSAESDSIGRAGRLRLHTNQLTIRDGASATVRSQGSQAGNLVVNARDVFLDNQAQLTATTTSGRGGNIQLQDLDRLSVSNSRISSSTVTGRAGNVTVNAQNGGVQLDGELSRIQPAGLSVAATGRGGRAGNLTINANQLAIQNGASATVSSPNGRAGNLNINAGSVTLNNGRLEAIAGEGRNGNINLTMSGPLLQLQRDDHADTQTSNELDEIGVISARAVNEASGGNVTLNVRDGFVLSNLLENNDIIADAQGRGNGGRIQINTQAIFGLEERDPRTPLSDINASSRFGIDGTIILNTLQIDPSRGLAELPTDIIDNSNLVASGCLVRNRTGQGEFVRTGRGGLSPNPTEPLSTEATITRLATLDPGEDRSSPASSVPSDPTQPLIEAQGLAQTASGKVAIVANSSTTGPYTPVLPSTTCDAP